MAASGDDGEVMSAAELKPLLRLSRRRPVSCAICMTKDREGVVLLNRRMKPRKVMAELRRQATAASMGLNTSSIRFGRATVDGASDSTMVRFTVNKAAPGAMRIALLEQLRPAGFQRCEIVVDEALEAETDDGEEMDDVDGEDGAGGEDGAASEDAAPGKVSGVLGGGGAARPDVAALRTDLLGLVRELAPVIAQEPARKQALLGLATTGQASLKTGDVATAIATIDELRHALHPADEAGPDDAGPDEAGMVPGVSGGGPPERPQVNGAAAGLPFIRGASPGTPGNGAVTPEIAAALLRNLTEGRTPFRPELGQVGPVSWFITEGNPYSSAGADKSVTIPVEVTNPSGKPPLRFAEADLVKIYDAKMPAARALVEQQIRAAAQRTRGEPLNSAMRKDLERRSKAVAEREMWTEVGKRTAASESGVGKVELKNSIFSQSGDGEFTLTSRADAVRIKGGSQALLKIITEHGAPAEPGVLEAAKKLAISEKWGGRVQGAFRVGGKVLIVVGIGLDAYKIYTASNKAKAVAEVAGGWTAATLAGSAFAAEFAPADVAGPVAWAIHGIGTLVVGGVAYYFGSKAGGTIYELATEGVPMLIGP